LIMIKTFIIKIISLAFPVIFFSLVSCTHVQDQSGRKKPVDLRGPLIEANKEAVVTESDQIDDFIARHGWKMKATSTGLRYMVYHPGDGPQAEKGKTVILDYTLSLLTGDTVYTSSKDGPLEFVVGRGEVISGLEEAILLLRVGDRVKIIIPSHLAYGLIGDQKKINFKASLVYDLDFVSMN
jgi:FKBP-type peptidyl-prolyl cis-trans isomerase FkpA